MPQSMPQSILGPRVKSVRCAHPGGFHDMVYSDWGPQTAQKTVLCVHGLTRNGQDFNRLANALAKDGVRVLAPDIVGRGRSDWLGPLAAYEIPQYINDLTVLLASEGLHAVDWLGTSMGGLIGFAVATMAGHPIQRLMVNDVGPFLPATALSRIADYVGVLWEFDDFDQGLDHVMRAYAPFGLTEAADWRELAEISLKRRPDGKWSQNYDPRIAEPFKAGSEQDIDMWALWDRISVPTGVLRGAESDLLSAETAQQMTTRGPKAKLVTFPNCGHAPALMEAQQIDVVRDWIAAG